MSTISTRALSSKQAADKLAISFDPALADIDEEKSGFITFRVNSVTWTGDNLSSEEEFTLDLRSAAFNEKNDSPLIDNLNVASDVQASSLLRLKNLVVVNRGTPCPSVLLESDGTWTLAYLKTELPVGTPLENLVVTVDYTITFTEFNYFEYLTAKSLTLKTTPDQKFENISVLSSTYTGDGIFALLPVSLQTSIDELGITDANTTPYFYVNNSPSDSPYGNQFSMLEHGLAKSSNHTKSYKEESIFLYAVNDGKIDANGSLTKFMNDGTLTSRYVLASVTLLRTPTDVTGDETEAVFNYKLGYIAQMDE